MLHVLAISDSRPGHVKKTESLLLALHKNGPVKVSWLEVSPRNWWFRFLAHFFLHQRPNFTKRLVAEALLKNIAGTTTRPDLIVSSGANTLFANVVLASRWSCPNVFIGSLRNYSPASFWRVVTVDITLKELPGFLYIPGVPTLLDREKMMKDAEALGRFVDCTAPLWALLVGGDGAGYQFSRSDVLMLADVVNSEYERNGVRWMITTSRRTGKRFEELLERSLKKEAVALFSRWSVSAGGNYHGILELSQSIICTDDSQMMVAEAIATGKTVASLFPVAQGPRSNAILERYCERGLLTRVGLDTAASSGIVFPERKSGAVVETEEILWGLVLEIQNVCADVQGKS